jgi:hypothetical protein
MLASMVTTAPSLPGYTLTRNLGVVRGITVRSRSIVAPTPFALASGLDRQVTLIDLESRSFSAALHSAGSLVRVETQDLIASYVFDLTTNNIEGQKVPNPDSGKQHQFKAYRSVQSIGPLVEMVG